MSAAITATLHRLLMQEDQVTLPGIGTLRLVPQPALISPYERKALPPSEQVTFNANLVLDDGRLLRALKETGGLDPATAAYQLDQFLRKTRENLDAGRTVTLEGIGRLAPAFDGQLKFTPATGANFSKEHFGLPVVELRPIVRTEKEKRKALATDPMLATPAAAPPPPPPRPRAAWEEVLYHPELRRILWYVAGVLAAILIVCLLYLLGQTIGGALADEPAPPVARNREEPPPPAEPPRLRPDPDPVPARTVAPEEPPRLNDADGADPVEEAPPPVVDPPPAAPAGANVSLIATGLYGSQRNVTKNLRRIEEAGYDSFSRPEDQYTRIGVRLTYRTEAEKNAALADIRRRFSDDAFEMERNGTAVPYQ